MSRQMLQDHRATWHQKPVLRAIYNDFYRRIVDACCPGLTLEVGGGSGNLKEHSKEVVSTDIVPTPWLDAAADAQALPFVNESFDNVVAVDVLHHVEHPRHFLAEIERILRPSGRAIFLDPSITPVSWGFYHFLHPEPVNMGIDPYLDGPSNPNRDPFDANQAIPTLMFGKYKAELSQLFPLLRLREVHHLSLFAYPLSGGFRPWCLIPAKAAGWLIHLEGRLSPLLGELMGFRMLVILEKAKSV